MLSSAGQPSFRYPQICDAIFAKKIKKYSEITALPVDFRQQLSNKLGENTLTISPFSVQNSKQVLRRTKHISHSHVKATKVLFELHDKHKIEAVHMNFLNDKSSVCISRFTQY
jgi:adenine C2-methylase RlmN of 23S rRNA A2503 and tRNA A37